MRLLGVSCVVALGAAPPGHGLRLPNSFLSISSDSEMHMRISDVQEYLDSFCEQKYKSICNSGKSAFCGQHIVLARHDVGTSSQKKHEWRCYGGSTLDMNLTKNGCVDECGDLTECKGAVVQWSKNHTSAVKELTHLIDSHKRQDCGTDMEEAISPGESLKDPVPIPETEESDSEGAVTTPPLLGAGPSGSETESAGSAGTEQIPPPIGELQEAMDKYCAKRFSGNCKKNPHFCGHGVARHGIGRKGEPPTWRCYSSTALDFSQTQVACVDDCGRIEYCDGAVDAEGTDEQFAASVELATIIDKKKDEFCKEGK